MSNEVDQRAGRRIQELRAAKSMTQGDLIQVASAMGLELGLQTLARIEKGQRSLRLNEALVISQILGVPLGALVEGGDASVEDINQMNQLIRCGNAYSDALHAFLLARLVLVRYIEASGEIPYDWVKRVNPGGLHVSLKMLYGSVLETTEQMIDEMRGSLGYFEDEDLADGE